MKKKARQKQKTPYQIEIRDPDDELVTHSPADVHIERMDDNHWWMLITVGNETVDVNFVSDTPISASMERNR